MQAVVYSSGAAFEPCLLDFNELSKKYLCIPQYFLESKAVLFSRLER